MLMNSGRGRIMEMGGLYQHPLNIDVFMMVINYLYKCTASVLVMSHSSYELTTNADKVVVITKSGYNMSRSPGWCSGRAPWELLNGCGPLLHYTQSWGTKGC